MMYHQFPQGSIQVSCLIKRHLKYTFPALEEGPTPYKHNLIIARYNCPLWTGREALNQCLQNVVTATPRYLVRRQ